MVRWAVLAASTFAVLVSPLRRCLFPALSRKSHTRNSRRAGLSDSKTFITLQRSSPPTESSLSEVSSSSSTRSLTSTGYLPRSITTGGAFTFRTRTFY